MHFKKEINSKIFLCIFRINYCFNIRDIEAPQAIASLGVGVVGLGEGKENSRIFGQVRS